MTRRPRSVLRARGSDAQPCQFASGTAHETYQCFCTGRKRRTRAGPGSTQSPWSSPSQLAAAATAQTHLTTKRQEQAFSLASFWGGGGIDAS
eukprot:4925560-Pyramimonas_sp.AAC.1